MRLFLKLYKLLYIKTSLLVKYHKKSSNKKEYLYYKIEIK